MKIKIIDLLNLVYEEKAPKKILYRYCEYEFDEEINDYKNKDSLELFSYLFQNEEQALLLEIEIIEERPKEIEELEFCGCNIVIKKNEHEGSAIPFMEIALKKINEQTKAINYLLKKEDEK